MWEGQSHMGGRLWRAAILRDGSFRRPLRMRTVFAVNLDRDGELAPLAARLRTMRRIAGTTIRPGMTSDRGMGSYTPDVDASMQTFRARAPILFDVPQVPCEHGR